MAATASVPRKESGTFLGEVFLAPSFGKPVLILSRSHSVEPSDHLAVLIAAELVAKNVVTARLGGGEPFRRVFAGYHVAFNPESRDGKIVDDILRGEDELHWLTDGHMELADFVPAVVVSDIPIPLDAQHIDGERVSRRLAGIGKNERSPDEKADEND